MRTLRTSEAAALLGIGPNTLRTWERRYGYPKPQRSAGGQRMYAYAEIAALRDALQQGLGAASAISRAREGLSIDSHAIVDALAGFELADADRAMESTLALRSIERSIEEVLLPSLDELARRYGTDSALWAFGARWANGWLRRALRLTPPPERRITILLGDATGGELDPDALAVRALELFCARSGARVISLPVASVSGLTDLVDSLAPNVVVIAGGHLPDEDVALWTHSVHATARTLPVALFRRADRETGRHGAAMHVLPEEPHEAHQRLLALGHSRRSAAVAESAFAYFTPRPTRAAAAR